MADPITWLAVGSAALGGVGAIQQGFQAEAQAKSQANMAEYNAQMAEMQARQEYAQAGAQEDLQRRRARAAIGTQLASNAQAGGGLNTDLLRQSLYGAETDALAIRYDGALRASGFKSEADLQRSNAAMLRSSAKQAKTAGFLSAAGSLMNAGTAYYQRSGGSLNKLRLLPGEE